MSPVVPIVVDIVEEVAVEDVVAIVVDTVEDTDVVVFDEEEDVVTMLPLVLVEDVIAEVLLISMINVLETEVT